jgi:glyoxylase-like metal-dependent hydrolase (beta-lactamase superfamily II)
MSEDAFDSKSRSTIPFSRTWGGAAAAVVVASLVAPVMPSGAQDVPSLPTPVDLAGEWVAHSRHEDEVHRIPGAELGDYAGFPLNDAGKLKAETWDASILSQPEQQARPHPAQYSMRGPGPNFRMLQVVDPATSRLVAYRISNLFGNADRTIWLDGRPHPSANAEHTWDGFSTGEWVRGALKVTTSHMKAAFINRNGAPASVKSTMTEFFVRHGRYLLLLSIVDDPVYLEEPFVRTSTWASAPNQVVPSPVPFEIVDEVAPRPTGYVPSFPMGTRHDGFAKRFGLPFEATRGGAVTMYPEYAAVLKKGAAAAVAAAAPAAPARRTPPSGPPPAAATGGLEVLPVQGNVHAIFANGANIVVQAGEQGAFVVDAGNGIATETVLAAVRRLTRAPIRYLVNTSADADHVGGNAALAAAGQNFAAQNAPGNSGIPIVAAPIIAREEVLNRMSAPTGAVAPMPFAAWPSSTFTGGLKTVFMNGEGIELRHQPAAHTDGDTLVYFRASDVIASGDVFSTTGFPRIDVARGGTVQGVLDALNRIIDITIPRFNQQGGTRVVPGHGRICNEADVVEYRDMVTIIRDRVAAMAGRGLGLAQIVAARPGLDYEGVYGASSGPWTTAQFIEAVLKTLPPSSGPSRSSR